ncbi:centrosomal protein of 128 kDa isoform X2 [Amphiprion ocellaris]|uniref:centrosomal protein of 128 kDa isoform X2 n=1 Tax=Amphiprion ocellaris TaxID=80972 RepID=UPI002410DC48|nr:centrosomal protein of 128 kDa isoform X2 [Amphiprion ocellaris]
MFSPSCRSSSPFSLTDLDMWDTKSRFTSQTSAWCGMATVSGSGFMSKVNTSGTGGFRSNEPGLRRWQSLSHLAPESPRSFPPPGAELRAARGESSFRQAEAVQWLQGAHERIDAHLDRLKTRDTQLSYSISSAQLLGMKHKLSEVMSALEQEKEAAELPRFEKSQQYGGLREKVLKLEKDLLLMRSSLNNNQPTEQAPGSSRGLPVGQDSDRQTVDPELYKLREALREAETRAKAQEEERNQALQRLQTSTETQKTLLHQIEEMNKKLSQNVQNHSEVQEQLSEANNKISQACLEKAILSTQVLKLEDSIKELKAKLTAALSDKDHLIQEKADLLQKAQLLEMQLKSIQHGSEGCSLHDRLTNTEPHNNKQDQSCVLMNKESKALREVNEKLRGELEMIKQMLEVSKYELQELTEETILNNKQITNLEAEEERTKMKEKCCQSRVLELENQKLQDQCLRLEAEVLEKEKMLHLQDEEYQKQDVVRVQSIEELKAMTSHWTEKWQKAALTLQSTQEELQELKKSSSRNEKECDSLLMEELDACKQELQLERSRIQAPLHKHEDKGGEAVQTQDKQTWTDLSESSLSWESPWDTQMCQNTSPQACIQNREVQRLKQKLADREKDLSEKEHALKTLERLREMEKTEAHIKISALEHKLMKNMSEDGQDDVSLQADVSNTDSLCVQPAESRRTEKQLQQEESLAVQKIQTLRQLYPVKDEKPSVEGRKDKAVCLVNLEADQQRRMVTEQLKTLFQEREGKEGGKVGNTSAAAQTGASSPQDRASTSKVVRPAANRRTWQQCSGLMPVFEEDEESSDCAGDEEAAEEADAEESLPSQKHQMSAMTAEISNLKEKKDSLLQALRFKQPIQKTAEKAPDQSSCYSDECDLQWRQMPPLYPDGLFLAEVVDICSPDEDEEEVRVLNNELREDSSAGYK